MRNRSFVSAVSLAKALRQIRWLLLGVVAVSTAAVTSIGIVAAVAVRPASAASVMFIPIWKHVAQEPAGCSGSLTAGYSTSSPIDNNRYTVGCGWDKGGTVDYIWIDAGYSVAYSFSVPAGGSQSVTYGIPAGGYVNNVPATVTLDGSKPVTIDSHTGPLGSTTPTDLYLWTSPELRPGLHKVTITSHGSAVNVYGMWLGSQVVTGNTSGYRLVSSDGGVFAFGTPFLGSLPGKEIHVSDVVGMTSAGAGGYWIAEADGSVHAFGDALALGSLPDKGIHVSDIVGIASPDSGGFWLVGSDGSVYPFGDAKAVGSLPGDGIHLSDIVGIAGSGSGYRLVGSDGAVFAFGAPFLGSLPGKDIHVSDIVGIASSAGGYRLVGRDGGVYEFGSFTGSVHAQRSGTTTTDVVGVANAEAGGYWLAGADGGVAAFGDAKPLGSMAGKPLALPIVGIAVSSSSSQPPREHFSLPAGTVLSAALATGTSMVFAGTVDGIPVRVTCTNFSASGRVPAQGLVIALTGAPTFSGCKDSAGGTDVATTNTTSGSWLLSEVDVDSGGSAKEPAPGDMATLTVPQAGATFKSSLLPSCTVTVAPKSPDVVTGSFDDSNTITYSNSSMPVAGSGCTFTGVTVTATIVLNHSVHDEP